MNDADVLDHLLAIEAKASALINDAQVEADKKITEAEKQNRASYESNYRKGVAVLDAEYRQLVSDTQERSRNELAGFREMMDAIKIDTSRFSAVLESLFAGEI